MKLSMTALHPNLKPPISFDQGDEFADLHSAQFTPRTLDLLKKRRPPKNGPYASNTLLHHCYTFSGAFEKAAAYTRPKEIENMKMIKTTLLVSMLLVLSGCMVVPVGPGTRGHYGPGFYGPTIGFGVYGRDGGRDGGRGGDRSDGRGEGRGYDRGHGRD
jgi:hypothetical protein